MTFDPKNLGWTAQCYLLGELSAGESAAFETLLETDQTARESLALAVELAEGCRLAEAEMEIEHLQPLEVASGGELLSAGGVAGLTRYVDAAGRLVGRGRRSLPGNVDRLAESSGCVGLAGSTCRRAVAVAGSDRRLGHDDSR